jgi:hypothetical protein
VPTSGNGDPARPDPNFKKALRDKLMAEAAKKKAAPAKKAAPKKRAAPKKKPAPRKKK